MARDPLSNDDCKLGLAEARLELEHPVRCVPRLSRADLQIQEVLGTGGFCTVLAVHVPEELLHGEQNANHRKSKIGRRRYALKQLRTDNVTTNVTDNTVAIENFKLEAELLSKLPEHPNIVKLVAISDDFFSHSQAEGDGFLILECLHETLQFRLERWKSLHHHRHAQRKLWQRSSDHHHRTAAVAKDQKQRLQSCALGLSHALRHLHRHDIIYRDLKPDNVGFAANDDGPVRLFDFGLARSCCRHKSLAGAAGTARYSTCHPKWPCAKSTVSVLTCIRLDWWCGKFASWKSPFAKARDRNGSSQQSSFKSVQVCDTWSIPPFGSSFKSVGVTIQK